MKRFLASILTIIVILHTSCTERIEIELDSSYQRLIVFGEITNDTGIHRIKLSRSSDYFSNNKTEKVSGADVEIKNGDKKFLLKENPDVPGEYLTNKYFHGIEGETYELLITGIDINNDGIKEEYRAESTMPFINKLDSIRLNYRKSPFFSGWEVLVWAKDPVETRDYYSFKVYKNSLLLTNILTEYFIQNDDFFNGNYTNGIMAQFLNDESETDKALPGDTVIFEINSITKDYYIFLTEAMNEARPGNPLFSGPPANISSNIDNGALGFFAAYSVARKTTIVPGYPSKNP